MSYPAVTDSNADKLIHRIGSMEIIRYDDHQIALPSDCDHCHCGLLKISSDGVHGWGEYALPSLPCHFDMISWASVFSHLKGLTLEEAIHYVEESDEAWGHTRRDLALCTLLDLNQRLQDYRNHQERNEILSASSILMDYSQSYYSF